MTKIIIVGGVAGGASAAARARRLSEDAEIIIAKNRQGGTGSIELGWWPKYTLFFDKDDARLPSEPPPGA